MNLYLDASALVKRYVAEPESDVVGAAMRAASGWFICRIGFVETVRAVGIAAGLKATEVVVGEWPAFAIVEIDQQLVENAAALALDQDLRSLDALHLAAALVLAPEDLVFATWDRRLHAAALTQGLAVLPDVLA
ncbi:MAG: type II toxin-antitoxin system VapC family toxin [Solirubrobacteraceae bacterium]